MNNKIQIIIKKIMIIKIRKIPVVVYFDLTFFIDSFRNYEIISNNKINIIIIWKNLFIKNI